VSFEHPSFRDGLRRIRPRKVRRRDRPPPYRLQRAAEPCGNTVRSVRWDGFLSPVLRDSKPFRGGVKGGGLEGNRSTRMRSRRERRQVEADSTRLGFPRHGDPGASTRHVVLAKPARRAGTEGLKPDESEVDRGGSGPESPGLFVRHDSLAVEGWCVLELHADWQRPAVLVVLPNSTRGSSSSGASGTRIRCARDPASANAFRPPRSAAGVLPTLASKGSSGGSSSGSAQRRETGSLVNGSPGRRSVSLDGTTSRASSR